MRDEPKSVCIGGYFCRRMSAKLLTFYSPPNGAGGGRLGVEKEGKRVVVKGGGQVDKLFKILVGAV